MCGPVWLSWMVFPSEGELPYQRPQLFRARPKLFRAMALSRLSGDEQGIIYL